MSDPNEVLEVVSEYVGSVDMLLKAIADDDRTAFVSAIAVLGHHRTELGEAMSRWVEVAA